MASWLADKLKCTLGALIRLSQAVKMPEKVINIRLPLSFLFFLRSCLPCELSHVYFFDCYHFLFYANWDIKFSLKVYSCFL